MERALKAQTTPLAASVVVLDELFALSRKLALHAPQTPEVNETVRALAGAIVEARPPFSFQVFADLVLRDRRPFSLPIETLRRCQQLVSACERWGVNELVFQAVPKPAELVAFAGALLPGAHGEHPRMPELASIRGRSLVRIEKSAQLDEAALEAQLVERLTQAIEKCAELAPRDNVSAWPWSEGRALTWQLERCMHASVTATGRALELMDGPWSPARRSVSAAFRAGAVLARLQVSPLTQRAVMHALILLGCYGYAEREGIALSAIARFARPRWIAQRGGESLDPHRMRVCALLSAALHADGGRELPVMPLLHAAYELERRRCPADLAFDLSRLELQAWLASALGKEVDADWGRALLNVLGAIPVGAYVLADGRLGVVAGPHEHGDAQRPRVLVGGEIVACRESVQLCSPFGSTNARAHRA